MTIFTFGSHIWEFMISSRFLKNEIFFKLFSSYEISLDPSRVTNLIRFSYDLSKLYSFDPLVDCSRKLTFPLFVSIMWVICVSKLWKLRGSNLKTDYPK